MEQKGVRRNDKEENDEENKQMEAHDFTKLLNESKSTGGYFEFRDEKSWSGKSSIQSNEYFSQFFNLNLTMLNDSIMTIPFYERLNLEKSLFNEEELKMMDEKARLYSENYKRIYQSDGDTDDERLASKKQEIVKGDQKPKHEDIDELLDSPHVKSVKSANRSEKRETQTGSKDVKKNAAVKPDSGEDMQKWLDDVLNI